MAVESVGSSAAGDPQNGRSKNAKGEQFAKMPIDSVLSLDGLSDRAKLVYAAIRKWDWGQGCFIPLPLTERQIFRKLGFEKGGQIVKPRSERW